MRFGFGIQYQSERGMQKSKGCNLTGNGKTMLETKSRRGLPQASAALGAIVWLTLLLITGFNLSQLDWIALLMLLAPLVIVPLGLSLIAPAERERRREAALYHMALVTQPFGACLTVISFFLEQGKWAALVAAGWLLVTGLIALHGLARLVLSRFVMTEMTISVGLLYIAIGGGWLVVSRFGWQPLGFGDTIVLLTAVHFHYAGFAAPLLAGLAGRRLQHSEGWSRRGFPLVAACVISGTPLVAAGITLSPAVALLGAIAVALGLVLLAVIVCFCIVPHLKPRLAQVLLVVSNASSALAMMLACLYAYSIVTKQLIINIPQMALIHGTANALGFSLCGMIAWSLVQREGV
jgi:hypothetical protein